MYKNFFSRWCDQLWLYVTYLLGAVMAYVLIWYWQDWSVVKIVAAIFAISTPLHIFEENTLPGGFPYMNNLGYKWAEPRVYPQNRCTNMITNLGATIVFIAVVFFADEIPASVMSLIAFFGISQTIFHTRCGIQMKQRYAHKGKKTIYGPGMISCWCNLMPLSIYAIKWLVDNGCTVWEVLGGIGIFLGVAVFLILTPFAFSIKMKSQEFAIRDLGYFEKYEK